MNVAQERDFYSPEPLNSADKSFLQMDAASTKRPDLIEFVNEEIALRDEMFAALEEAKVMGDASALSKLETSIHNAEESYQGMIENRGAASMGALLEGNVGWAADDREWQNFILYFATQYLRTKRIQEKLRQLLEPQALRMGYSVERVWPILRNLETVRLADGIYRSTSLVLLENPSRLEYITCDQPAFNAMAPDAVPEAQPGQHEFYYPISPRRAVLLVEGTSRRAPTTRVATEEEITKYNQVIKNVALEQIYGRIRDVL